MVESDMRLGSTQNEAALHLHRCFPIKDNASELCLTTERLCVGRLYDRHKFFLATVHEAPVGGSIVDSREMMCEAPSIHAPLPARADCRL